MTNLPDILPEQLTTLDRLRSRSILVAPMIVAALSISLAIQIKDGEYSNEGPTDHRGPLAIGLITLGLLANIVAVTGPMIRPGERRWSQQLTGPFFAIALIFQFLCLFISWPGVDLEYRDSGFQRFPFHAGFGIAAILLAFGPRTTSKTFRRIWFPSLLTIFGLLGAWMVFQTPNPNIDVWMFQQDAASQLLHGKNPYAMTFPDIYHSTLPGHQPVYGPGLVENDRLQFGFPYPPVSLLLETIGYALARDHRYAQVAALILAGWFMGRGGRQPLAGLAAALLLFTPRVLFVISRGWTEPFVVMLLAATVFLAVGRSPWLPIALGLLLACKQYLVFALPLTFFLLPTGWKARELAGLLLKSIVVAAAVTLPFVLWDVHAFWKSTVTVQELSPFRWDALSYLVFWGFRGHVVDNPLTAVICSTTAAIGAMALCLWRAPRTPAGFAASLSLLSLGFFAFNKQAFCNYYFFVIGAMCCAIAASGARSAEAQPRIRAKPA